MRIPSGVTDQYIYFVAVDPTDLKTRETGLTTFTVYYSKDGGTATQISTPTVNETDATNMPGVYELLLSAGTTIGSGNGSEELALHITHASMAPVTRVIEIYDPNFMADALLARDIGSGTGAGSLDERTVRSALRFLRNKWSISANTLTVTKEDDSTSAWTCALTTSAGVNPVTTFDPNGP